ncbi:putative signal recognition particle subunit SRP72 [Vairimorpha necatrix]|uniref:Signal recognition particle subunit SRP72 n=1 Tax=Vairimorpha necatrix TaxID=6039 RepID=A0AAX4J8R8_9MICR
MIDPNNFQTLEEHEKLANLDIPDIKNFKAVAFLHIGKFEEALKFSQKDSYESAYALYKLRKYKKALKIANKHSGEKWDVLKSQILYCMGYFNEAFKFLNKLKKDDEIVVNLQAMQSLGELTNKVNKHHFHNLYIKKKEEDSIKENLEDYKFKDEEIYYEFLFNKTFECAENKTEYLGNLKKLSDQFPKANIFKMQMANIEGYFDEINPEDLSKTQRQVYNFNSKKSDTIENGLHYLSNFSNKLGDNQYKWIENAKKNNFKINWNEIPDTSETLNILRILTGLENKNIKIDNIKKCLEKIKNENVKQKIEEYLNFNK